MDGGQRIVAKDQEEPVNLFIRGVKWVEGGEKPGSLEKLRFTKIVIQKEKEEGKKSNCYSKLVRIFRSHPSPQSAIYN